MDDERIKEVKRDTSRLVVIFKNFVEDYKTALGILIEAVEELEEMAEEVQKSSYVDKSQGGEDL